MQNEDIHENGLWNILFAAWIVALISTLGALFIGEVMEQTPCLLCWYQRIAMFPLAIILMIACFKYDLEIWYYALPLALAGGVIAAYHSLLYLGIIPKTIEPCGQGPSCSSSDMTIFGHIPLPLLSLGAFLTIACLLLFIRKRKT